MTATTDAASWRRTSPLAVLFFFGRLVRSIIKNAAQSLAPLAAFIFAFDGPIADRIGIAVGFGLLIGIIAAVLRYLFFGFQIAPDSVLIREGVFKKKQLDIKFHRIQGVNIEQSFIAKWFGLVNIRFDTAGSSTDEGVLPGVTASFADELQARIDGVSLVTEEASATPESLLKLRVADMIKIGLADGRALLLLAALVPLIEQGGDRVEKMIYNAAASGFDQLQSFGIVGGLLIALLILTVVTLLLVAGSIAAAFLRYHDFQLMLEVDRVRTIAGLFTRHQASMKLQKIQRVRMSQNIMLRLFGRYRLRIQQASSSGKKKESNSISIPLVSEDVGDQLTRQLFEPEGLSLSMRPDDSRFIRIHRHFVRSRTLLYGVLPSLVLATPLILLVGPLAAVGLLWIGLVYVTVQRYWRRMCFYITNTAVVRRRGLFGFGLDAFLSRKVQRVSVSQSFLQKRKGFATIRIYLASGNIRLPYLTLTDANRLRDYLLFKVESDPRAWH